MAQPGTGAIIIWNDVAPEGRDAFYSWHIAEHIPERVAIPGFLDGSRYVAVAPDTRPEFLTLYRTAGPAVATSAAYLARLNAPTDWTRRATAHFRNTSRALTHVVHGVGGGLAGVVATIRFEGFGSGPAALAEVRAAPLKLTEIGSMPRIASVALCATNAAASAARSTESRERTDILAAPVGAVLIAGCEVAAVRAAVEIFMTNRDRPLTRDGVATGIYALEYALSRPPAA